MVKYLSPAWFARLGEAGAVPVAAAAGGDPPIVLRQVVTGTPEGGEVRYDIVVSGGAAALRPATAGAADVTVTSDYATASDIAAGRLSTVAALAAGRLKVTGDPATLAGAAGLAGVDPMPSDLRADTEFGP